MRIICKLEKKINMKKMNNSYYIINYPHVLSYQQPHF